MADQVIGSVTPLASVFPPEEVQKAAKRVQDAIVERQKELEHLHFFATDNTNLINLVQRLPDELSHDIMVPFGKAAFFPGRLIHTNEFLVLLGEGYYAERTAKQTVEILQRRGKTLEYQIESLRSVITDLEVEAKYFDSTAIEAKEGLVEIREDYIEEPPSEKVAESGTSTVGTMNITDEEYAYIQSRLDELEKEELAAASASSDDNDNSVEEKQLESGQISKGKEVLPKQISDELSPEDVKQQYNTKGLEYSTKHAQATKSENELVHEVTLPKVENCADNVTGKTSRVESDRPKAFMGSVVERSHVLPPSISTESSTQAFSSNPSKPVSRFMMRRGNR